MKRTRKPERWQPIPDFPYYEASDLGRVRSLYSQFGPRPIPLVFRCGLNKTTGYLFVTLVHAGRRYNRRVHQLVARTFLGPAPRDKPQVRHLNGNQVDNRLRNLRWGTAAENAADRIAHRTSARGLRHGLRRLPSRAPRGERNSAAKLSAAMVRKIVEELDAGATTKELAPQYGVCRATISHIKNGRNWRHLHNRKPGPHNQRLTDAQIAEIHSLLRRGFTQTEIGRRYEVTTAYIWKLKNGLRRTAVAS